MFVLPWRYVLISHVLVTWVCGRSAAGVGADVDAELQRGVELLERGDVKAARKVLRRAVAASPARGEAHVLLGVTLAEPPGNDFQGAKRSFRKGIELSPDDTRARSNLAYLLQREGDLAAAADGYRAAAKLDPTYVTAQYNLGNVLRELGDLKGARRAYARTVRLDSQHADAHNNLGRVLHELRDLRGAAKSFRKALRLRPGYFQSHFNLGGVLREMGDFNDAKQSYRTALHLLPDDAEAHSALAATLADAGDLAAAAESFSTALRLDPARAGAHDGLGSVLKKQGDTVAAKTSALRAVKLDPGQADYVYNLGGILRARQDWAAARDSYERAVRLRPGDVDALTNLGVSQWQLNDLAAAEQSQRLASRLDPTRQDVLYSLGNVLSQRGDVDGAKKTVRLRAQLAEKAGTWPFLLSMSGFDDNAAAASKLQHEEQFLDNYVAAFRSDALEEDTRIAALVSVLRPSPPSCLEELPGALKRVREMENTTSFAVRRWDACFALQAESGRCAYGATWFETWVSLMADTTLLSNLPSYVSNGLEVVVGGSALGEQCLFAAFGLGLPCRGYELLCDLVDDARGLLDAADNNTRESLAPGLAPEISFTCGDATKAKLASAAILFLNDFLWSPSVRESMFGAAAKSMPHGATVVSYLPAPTGVPLDRFREERTLRAGVSWDPRQRFYMYTLGPADAKAEL